jgi:hypothetical protein
MFRAYRVFPQIDDTLLAPAIAAMAHASLSAGVYSPALSAGY